MYSQAQLESFFGSNYDASTLSVALTYGGVTGFVTSLLPIILIVGVMMMIIRWQQKKTAVNNMSAVIPTAQTITSTDSTPNQIVSNAVSLSEISDTEENTEQSFYSAENVTAIDINSMNDTDTAIQSLICALENNVK